MDFLSREFNVEGVGGVTSTGKRHTELGRRDAQHLLCGLTEVSGEGVTGNATDRLQWVHLDLGRSLVQ